jgi:hypothetical protein
MNGRKCNALFGINSLDNHMELFLEAASSQVVLWNTANFCEVLFLLYTLHSIERHKSNNAA